MKKHKLTNYGNIYRNITRCKYTGKESQMMPTGFYMNIVFQPCPDTISTGCLRQAVSLNQAVIEQSFSVLPYLCTNDAI